VRDFLANRHIAGVIPLLIESEGPVDLVAAFPELEDLLRQAGHRGVAQLLPTGMLTESADPLVRTVSIFVQQGADWNAARKNLAGAQKVRLITDPARIGEAVLICT